jgi:hypothetical protein
VRLQHGEFICIERTAEARRSQRRQKPLIDALADRAVIQQRLNARITIHAPAQDSLAIQIQESVDEHLGACIQARLERRVAADGIERGPESLRGLE